MRSTAPTLAPLGLSHRQRRRLAREAGATAARRHREAVVAAVLVEIERLEGQAKKLRDWLVRQR